MSKEVFKTISKKEWTEKMLSDLRGKPFSSLEWKFDGLSKSPIFHKEDGIENLELTTKSDNNWQIGSSILVNNDKKANQVALADLNRGANSILFRFPSSYSLDFDTLLKGIQLEWISVQFQFTNDIKTIVKAFWDYVTIQGFDPGKIDVDFKGETKHFSITSSIIEKLPNATFYNIPINLQSSSASDVLSKAVYLGNQMFEIFENEGIDNSFWNNLILFSLKPEEDIQTNAIQIRSLKSLWLMVQKSWGIENLKEPNIEILTSDYGSENIENDLISACIQCLSSVLSSVKRVIIHHPTLDLNKGRSDFKRRILININHILKEESYMHIVSDPLSGSYFFDSMTSELGQKSWSKFQKMHLE